MTPPEGLLPATQARARMERCRKLADLLRADSAGGRLIALAHDIEQQLQRSHDVSAAIAETRRQRSVIREEIAGLVARCRNELFFARQLLRNGGFQAADLREEARLIHTEALDCDELDMRRSLSGSAAELAMMAEAFDRIP